VSPIGLACRCSFPLPRLARPSALTGFSASRKGTRRAWWPLSSGLPDTSQVRWRSPCCAPYALMLAALVRGLHRGGHQRMTTASPLGAMRSRFGPGSQLGSGHLRLAGW